MSESGRLRTIQIIIGVSIVFTLLVLGADAAMGTVGSYFTSGAICSLTFIHHVTLLALAGKQRNNNKLTTERSVLVRQPTLVCDWLLFVGWMAVLALASWNVHEQRTGNVWEALDMKWKGVEMLLVTFVGAIIEVPVFFTFALLSTLERRRPEVTNKV
ncbi:hypothetical protein BJ165DRAFT_1113312 [Panaeolus papilionaceus]|nr:hypothetical protein BJ165DRAFT_1113312 [Panaeolus papilionaceus]